MSLSNGEQQPNKKVEAARIVKKTARGSTKKADTLGELAAKKQSARTKPPSLFLFTLHFLYKNLYCLGITIMRRRLRLIRRFKLGIYKAKGSLYALSHHFTLFLQRTVSSLQRRVRAPFIRIIDAYRMQLPAIRERRAEHKAVLPAYLPVVEAVGRLVWKIIRTIINYVAPVAAGWYLLATISAQISQPIGLMLEYNGQKLGYIQNEARFDDATQIIRGRMTEDSTEQFAANIPTLTLEIIESQVVSLIGSADLADMIFRTSGEDFEEAYGFSVGNTFLGAVTDKDAIINELNAIRRENVSGKPNERVEFSKRIELTTLKPFPASSVVDPSTIVSTIRSNEDEQRTYIVEAGDSPSLIADKVSMPYVQLKALNPDIEEELFAGMEILVSGARPYLSVKTIYTDEYEEEIPFETIETQNALYAKGYRDPTQEGVEGLRMVTAEITMENGIETSREILKTVTLRESVPERVTVGVNNPASIVSGPSAGSTNMSPSGAASSTGFIWPTSGGKATTYQGHTGNGIDIAPGGAGHPIYASASGTVVKVQAGWTGYGHHIIIDHGNGYSTLYAHNSANYVSVGDYVQQGQVIAAMGRTGWATGNHLHFEVRYNGRYMWPPDYVGYSG